MWILVIVLLLAGLFCFVMFSGVGSDITKQTDAQLYRRYVAWLDHMKLVRADNMNGWVETQEELGRMADELERRGYDINRLFTEDTNAQWEKRPMDFSRARDPHWEAPKV